MSEAATKGDLAGLRAEVNGQLSGVRSDIRELTAALRDLIRLDGDIKRIEQAQGRIGREVENHAQRLRDVELQGAGDTKSVSLFDFLVRHSLSLVMGAALATMLLKGTS